MKERFNDFEEMMSYVQEQGATYMSVYRTTDIGKARWTDRALIRDFKTRHPKYASEPITVIRFYNSKDTSWSISWTYELVMDKDLYWALSRDCSNCCYVGSTTCDECDECNSLFKLKKDWEDNSDERKIRFCK